MITSPQVSIKIKLMVRLFLTKKVFSDAFNDHFASIGNKLAGEILDPILDYLDQKQARSIPDSHLREFSQNRHLIFSTN